MSNFSAAALHSISSGLYFRLKSYRTFWSSYRLFGKLQRRVATRLFSNEQVKVLSGPFQGLKYFNRTVWGPLTTKWLGTYEAELHAIIHQCQQSGYDTMVDVGAAEGYYAVGFAWSCPKAQVFSFDVDPLARARQRELAKLNLVEHLHIGKFCTTETLENLLAASAKPFVLCDIEGFECELLNPQKVPSLAGTDLLVEVHDFAPYSSDEVLHLLRERFSSTHQIEEIRAQPRLPHLFEASLPCLTQLESNDQLEALQEHRPEHQVWLWMKTRRTTHSINS